MLRAAGHATDGTGAGKQYPIRRVDEFRDLWAENAPTRPLIRRCRQVSPDVPTTPTTGRATKNYDRATDARFQLD